MATLAQFFNQFSGAKALADAAAFPAAEERSAASDLLSLTTFGWLIATLGSEAPSPLRPRLRLGVLCGKSGMSAMREHHNQESNSKRWHAPALHNGSALSASSLRDITPLRPCRSP